MTKTKESTKLTGLGGWLSFFIVGLFIGLGNTIYNLFAGGLSMTSEDISSLNEYSAGLGDTIQSLSTFENIALFGMIGLFVATLVLLFRKSKHAKKLAIITLVYSAVYSVVDYSIASSVFQSSGLDQIEEVQVETKNALSLAARNVIAAALWVPFFLKSERVKQTLVK